jgi:hypothetical protein
MVKETHILSSSKENLLVALLCFNLPLEGSLGEKLCMGRGCSWSNLLIQKPKKGYFPFFPFDIIPTFISEKRVTPFLISTLEAFLHRNLSYLVSP